MMIRFSARTDIGRVRKGNEDNFLVDRKMQLYIVCDGMGGHLGGEVASATAVNVIREVLLEGSDILEGVRTGGHPGGEAELQELIATSIQQASYRIYERGMMNPEQKGMGTTCTLMLVQGSKGYIGHVGDSRVYRWRQGEVSQVTEDHSLFNEMLKAGQIKPGQEVSSRLKNAVTRAVGVYETVEVDTQVVDLRSGDRYVLCSDGLSGYLEDGDLEALLADDDLGRSAQAMIDHANQAGGRDNITAVVLEVSTEGADLGVVPQAIHYDVVAHAPIFAGLSGAEMRIILAATRERVLEAGDEIGAPDGLYMVVSGELQIIDGDRHLASLFPGDPQGLHRLLTSGGPQIRLQAQETATLLWLPRSAFQQLLATHRALATRLTWQVAQHLAARLVALSQDPVRWPAFYAPLPAPVAIQRARPEHQRVIAATTPHLARRPRPPTQELDPADFLAEDAGPPGPPASPGPPGLPGLPPSGEGS